MVTKETFKEYLESKNQLIAATQKTPIQTKSYNITKYCKLPILNEDGAKEIVALKPKQCVFVEWEYRDIENPNILDVKISDYDCTPHTSYTPSWSGIKLKSWLLKNSTEM